MELWLQVDGRNSITVRAEPNSVRGQSLGGLPALCLPLELQLIPGGQHKNTQYTLVRLAGKLSNRALGEFASFDLGPLAEVPNAEPFFRRQEALVPLDRERIGRFEDARAGANANLSISLSALVWLSGPLAPGQGPFERSYAGPLEVNVPKSHWAESVVEPWGLDKVRLIEIRFPNSQTGDAFRNAYVRIEAAEKHYANAQYKEVLTSLRLSFERLASDLGHEGHVEDCFEDLFSGFSPDKKQKATEALNRFYRFLHLGPHEQAAPSEAGDQTSVIRQDARFALTMTYAIFDYITPRE